MTDNRATKGFSLKDQLFNQHKLHYLAGLFRSVDAGFNASGFVSKVMETMLTLELKARLALIAEVLEDYLPTAFPDAAKTLLAALPPPLDPDLSDNDFGDFILAPLGAYVANNGMDHPRLSLPLLREMTMRFSVEFDIRHFLNTHPERTMAVLADWATDENYHVRRLVSEGTRPVLPWGVKVGLHHTQPLPFLDILHADPTRYVTRSVANHLNDISKKNPALVVDTLARWAAEGRQKSGEMAWITNHALRTLIKRGNPDALALLGYRQNPDITVTGVEFPDSVKIGDVAPLEARITAVQDAQLMIDYVIEFVKKNGSTAPKVFKLKKLSLKAGQTVQITKAHRFLKDATTFTHYPGQHRLYMQINGQRFGETEFALI